MAKRPAKNMTSLPSHTIVPTATTLGRFTAGAEKEEVIDALVTLPLCLMSLWDFVERHTGKPGDSMVS